MLRAPSSARLHFGEEIVIDNFPSTAGPVHCTFRTHFVNEGFAVDVPRGVYAEVLSAAPNADEAFTDAMNAAMTLKAYIGFCTNASVGDFEVEVAFDVTPDSDQHEYVQQFVRAPAGIPQPGRWVSIGPTRQFVQAVAAHHRFDRVHRAIVHYELALRYWRREFAVLALSHLWIAAEALTPIAKDQLKAAEGVADDDALAAALGIEKKKLDPEVRKRVLFHEDAETYRLALRASDAYEHSFEDFHTVWQKATEVLEKTASHVRTFIFEIAGVAAEARTALLAAPYDRPFDAIPLTRRIRGVLNGRVSQLTAPEQLYPLLKWSSKIISFSRAPSGNYEFSAKDDYTPVIGQGTTFTGSRVEFYGPRPDDPSWTGPEEMKVDVEYKSAADHSTAAPPPENSTPSWRRVAAAASNLLSELRAVLRRRRA